MTEIDISLKRQLIEATKNSIKKGNMEDHTKLRKFYEPITTHSKTLIKQQSNIASIVKYHHQKYYQ